MLQGVFTRHIYLAHPAVYAFDSLVTYIFTLSAGRVFTAIHRVLTNRQNSTIFSFRFSHCRCDFSFGFIVCHYGTAKDDRPSESVHPPGPAVRVGRSFQRCPRDLICEYGRKKCPTPSIPGGMQGRVSGR